MTSRTNRTAAVITLAGLGLAGSAFLVARHADAQDAPPAGAKPAAKETAREAVERLFPDLLSQDATVRERAERDIAALGEPARRELDRIARDPDPKRAIAALRMLQSDRWDEAPAAHDEDGRIVLTPPRVDLRRWQERLDREMEEMHRRMEQFRREFNIEDWVPQIEHEDGATVRGRSSGTIVENGRTFRWDVDEAGKVRVTTKDAPDAEEKTVEAPSLEALRKDHPDLAKRLDEVHPRDGRSRIVIRWPARGADRAPRGEEDRNGHDVRGPLLEDEEVERLPPSEDPFAAPGPVLGISWSPVPDVLRDQLNMADGGMVVDTVTPNTLAARLGLRRNDVLIRLGDRVVSGPSDVRKALESLPEGAEVKAEILRKGRNEILKANR